MGGGSDEPCLLSLAFLQWKQEPFGEKPGKQQQGGGSGQVEAEKQKALSSDLRFQRGQRGQNQRLELALSP